MCLYCNIHDHRSSDCTEETSAVSALLSRPLTIDEMICRKRQYIEAIQPYIKQQANIMGLQGVRYIQQGDNWLREIIWHPGSRELFDMIGQCIEDIGRNIFQTR